MSVDTLAEPGPKITPDVTTLEDTILARLRQLPADKQQEVQDFVEFLHQRVPPKQPRQSLRGLWKGLVDPPITSEDIAEARKEMWGEYMGVEEKHEC